MQPINIIRQTHMPDWVIDIEDIAAKLEYHGYTLNVSNVIASDCGSKWSCELTHIDDPEEQCDEDSRCLCRRPSISTFAPSLRAAVLMALDKAHEDDAARKRKAKAVKDAKEMAEQKAMLDIEIPKGKS